MSDPTSLTVPDAGWYADRNDANTVRWWDGSQWTEHTHSLAPEQNVAQPVSVAAFGFTPVEPNPLAAASAAAVATGQPAPGWYPDNADPSIQRWWDGTQWTSHTAPGATTPIPSPTPGSYLGAYTTPVSPAVNTLATRGMIYSLIALVLNPFLILSIGGLVNGIRALRRVPQFAPENARRGSAIAAIAVGSVATVLSILVIAVAIIIPVIQHEPHFDQARVQEVIRSKLSVLAAEDVASVACPPNPALGTGRVFHCTAVMADDGRSVDVIVTFTSNNGDDYRWITNGLEDGKSTTTQPPAPPADDPDLSNS